MAQTANQISEQEKYWTKQLAGKAPNIARFQKEPFTITQDMKDSAAKRRGKKKVAK